MITRIQLRTAAQGLYDLTPEICRQVREMARTSGLQEGLSTLYLQHTSASLLIQENYDPSARVDLEAWLNRLVPENDPLYTHTLEGADDMPAHIKAALTATSLSIPLIDGDLALGQWQGIFLWEHRHQPQSRQIILHLA